MFRAANAGQKLLRSLAEIAGGTCDLELLPDAIGEDLYLGADRRFVVGHALHRNQHRVISVAALVVQEQGVSVWLGDDQIRGAIAVHIGGNQGARLNQLYLVELHARGHVLKARRTQVPQCTQLRPMRRFDRGHQVEPAIVVEVDGRQPPTCGHVL